MGQLFLSLAVVCLHAYFSCPIAFGEPILPCSASVMHSVWKANECPFGVFVCDTEFFDHKTAIFRFAMSHIHPFAYVTCFVLVPHRK